MTRGPLTPGGPSSAEDICPAASEAVTCGGAAKKMNRTAAIKLQPLTREDIARMRCIECDALLSEYKVTTERYAVLSGILERADIPERSGILSSRS